MKGLVDDRGRFTEDGWEIMGLPMEKQTDAAKVTIDKHISDFPEDAIGIAADCEDSRKNRDKAHVEEKQKAEGKDALWFNPGYLKFQRLPDYFFLGILLGIFLGII